MGNAVVKLQLVDTGDQPLVDPGVIAEFTSLDSAKHFRVQVEAKGGTTVDITLQNPGMGVYQVALIPMRYRMLQFFLRIQEGTTITRKAAFPVDASKVTSIQAPGFTALPPDLQTLLSLATVAGFGTVKKPSQGQALYESLPPVLKAAMLNFYVKSKATRLADDETVFSLIGPPVRLHQDRVFAKVKANLVEETKISPNFQQVPFSLHENIPPYKLFDSYKTRDAVGNLQLTFSRNGVTGNDYLVDMDIDEAQGIGHIFEVLQNGITESQTSPYNVREILLVGQHLQSLYSFQFADVGSASIATSA